MKIDEMEAGREMDAAVDEYVFSRSVEFQQGKPCAWAVKDGQKGDPVDWYPNDYVRLDYSPERDGVQGWAFDWHPKIVPRYSTEIGLAWLVVEKMQKSNRVQQFADCYINETPWHWVFLKEDAFCLHICRAALKVVFKEAA